MPAVTPLPTLSQIRNWDTDHLIQAAEDWDAEAKHWESSYEQNFRLLAETDWQGQGREAALERAGLDLLKVRGPAGQLAEAALAARYGYDQQNGSKEWALDAVTDAHQAGFRVNEDLSVTNTQTGGSAAQQAARQAQAQALSVQIRHRAALLVASNQEIAAKITAAAGDIGAFRFDEPTGAGGQSGRQHNGAVRPVANRTVANASPAADPQPPRPDVSNDQWNLGTAQHVVPPAPTADKVACPPPAASPSPAVSAGRPPPRLPTTRAGGSPLPGAVAGASAGTVGAALSGSAAWAGAGIAESSVRMGTSAISGTAAKATATAAAPMAQPLAHVQPVPPPHIENLTAQLHSTTGQAAHNHAAQLPPTEAPQAQPLAPPAATAPGPASPTTSTGSPTPTGGPPAPNTGSGGAQILGFGSTGLTPPPQAPRLPTPSDPTPPPAPPVDPKDMAEAQARAAWDAINSDIARWNARCGRTFVLPNEQATYDACIADRGPLLERQAVIRARLNDLGAPIEGEESAPPPTHEPPQATEDTPPFPPPTRINGLTEHGAEQVNGRDGHGVNDSALQDAVAHPIGPPMFELDEKGRGAYAYVGKDATVILNKDGQMVTAWANNRNGWRHP
jgi:hypothetical protein